MSDFVHNRHTIRLKGYDYSQDGYYFVTICIQDRLHILGTVGADLCVRPIFKNNRPINSKTGSINQNVMQLNDIGTMVERWWLKIVEKYPEIKLDAYQIMPNHIHGIIIMGQTHGSAPTINPTLGKIIQWFKTMTTNEYLRGVKSNGWERFGRRLWQRNYYEHIIRSEKEYFAIRRYIIDNSKNWDQDTENL